MQLPTNETSPDNVLLIFLDTVRAKSSYPTNEPNTPTIREVGERGACFTRAISPAPWTLPSHASVFTGLYPTEHGATTYDRRLPTSHKTVADHLSTNGLRTGLFSSNPWIEENYGIAQGFDVHTLSQSKYFKLFDSGIDFFHLDHRKNDTFHKVATKNIIRNPSPKNFANLIYVLYKEVMRHKVSSDSGDLSPRWDEQTVADCQKFIRENAGKHRFFAAVNLIQAHAPWSFDPDRLNSINITPSDVATDERWQKVADKSSSQGKLVAGEIEFTEKEKSILTHLYESWVHSVDKCAGNIIETLESENIRDETLVILTSDHGESIARNGILGHSVTLHEDVTHVPLVMNGPTIPKEPVPDTVSLKDLFGTILHKCNINTNKPCLFDDDGRGFAIAETEGGDAFNHKPHLAQQFGTRRAIFTEQGHAEIRYDSGEIVGPNKLIEKLYKLVSKLENESKENTKGADIGKTKKSQLKHLGYIE